MMKKNPKANRMTIATSTLIVGLTLSLVGCGPPPVPATFEQVANFSHAGPVPAQAMNIRWKAPSHPSNDGHEPINDGPRLMKAKVNTGPYRVVAGDLLGFTMPQVMRAVSDEATAPSLGAGSDLLTRVSDKGEITLPSVGPIQVARRTLGEIEAAIVAAYHPKYLVNPPAVVAQIHEYRTLKVAVVGAVGMPGEYNLRSDEMNLNALLTKANGIDKSGATVIRIHHSADGSGQSKILELPVHNLNIPHANVALAGGELIEVDRYGPRALTVLGLVSQPGVYPIQPGADHNILEALAMAGGIDKATEPRYVRVYRKDQQGQVVSAVFQINGEHAAEAYSVNIKPGDVVSVDHTDRTRMISTIDKYFKVSTGLFMGANYNFGEGSDNSGN